jgi:response regulator RpfG family c-di-GMP phosphodiesterase
VVVVDDDRDVREVVCASLDADPRVNVVGRAHDGHEGMLLVDEVEPAVVVMDVHMPGMDGCEATEAIVGSHPDVQVVALTGSVDPATITRMILAGAVGYAVKGADPAQLADAVVNAAHRRYFVDSTAVDDLFESVVLLARQERRRREEAEHLARTVKRAYRDTVTALVNALRWRDGETEAHGDRVSERVVAVCDKLGLSPLQRREAEYGAIFHDIGKIAVPDAILHNTDDLTEDEWRVIRQHTVIGEQIIKPVAFLENVATIVRHSHEHWDGSGYPDALVGDRIPIESRIVFACDAFDAMTSARSYQDAMSSERAIERMRELRGVHFDPQVVDALVEVIGEEQAAAAGERRAGAEATTPR